VTLPGFRARIRTEIKSLLWYSMPAIDLKTHTYIRNESFINQINCAFHHLKMLTYGIIECNCIQTFSK